MYATIIRPPYRGWQQSLNSLKNSFECSGMSDNRLIVELELPHSARPIDVLLAHYPILSSYRSNRDKA
jgi:hypothetical protein